MNLFRSEEHARRWAQFNPAAEEGFIDLPDLAAKAASGGVKFRVPEGRDAERARTAARRATGRGIAMIDRNRKDRERMLKRIGTKENIPDFIKGVKEGEERLMGFGHRVYKNYDPRAKIIKKACDDVFEVTGVNPLLEIAMELEKIALEDEYFVSRKLYPNVDFYSGLIYEAFQFPPEMFTVLFAIGRTPGWLAQWLELVQDKEQKIARPKQIYTGHRSLEFAPASERWA